MKVILALVLCFQAAGCAMLPHKAALPFDDAVRAAVEVQDSCTNLVVAVGEHGEVSISGLPVKVRKLKQIQSVAGLPQNPPRVLLRVHRNAPHADVMAAFSSIGWNLITEITFQYDEPAERLPSALSDSVRTRGDADSDIFRRGVQNWSTAPSYVLATIATPGNPKGERVCLEGTSLIGAICFEENMPDDIYGLWKATKLSTANTARSFTFRNPNAAELVKRNWSANVYAEVADALKGLITSDLKRLVEDEDSWIHERYRNHEQRWTCEAAFAAVLLEHGIPCLRGCEHFDIYLDKRHK